MSHRILIIDDNPQIHEDFRKVLGMQDVGGHAIDSDAAKLFGSNATSATLESSFELDFAFQGKEGLRMAENAIRDNRPYSLAFVDVRMPPGWDGIETVRHLWETYPDLQVVICTAYSDYTWRSIIQALGKSEGLVILKKPFEYIEVLQLAHALTEKWTLNQDVQLNLKQLDQLVEQRTKDLRVANEQLQNEIKERESIRQSLNDSEERFQTAFSASPLPLALLAPDESRYLDVNPAFESITGFSQAELTHQSIWQSSIWKDADTLPIVEKLFEEKSTVRRMTCTILTKEETSISVQISTVSIMHNVGPCLMLILEQGALRANANSEEHSNKMELVGRMTAGIAHDFNNLITIIQGYAEMALVGSAANAEVQTAMKQVSLASKKATVLTNQLLSFSRTQGPTIQDLDLNGLIRNLAPLLSRLLHEGIHLNLELADTEIPIQADEGMLDQVLLNLAANARDAMPNGGELTIGTSIETTRPPTERSCPSHGNSFTCIRVKDTGAGMEEATVRKIFDPFFTTKEVGKGTGLGLATVQDIMIKHQGWIEVQSTLQTGTEFHLYLPLAKQPGT